MNETKKIVYAAMFIALGVLVPQVFHFTGIANAGTIFLPMHIPVILCGFVLGPYYGAIVGALTPFLSSILLSMPPMQRMPFMVIELAVYAFVAGMLYHKLGFYKRKFGIYLSLVVAMVAGRIVFALCLWLATNKLAISNMGPIAALDAVIKGIPGILIQLVILPALVYQLKKGSIIEHEFSR